MHAIRMHQEGGPEVLQLDDVEEPRAGPGQLLLDVRAASVNPVDCKIRNGTAPFHPKLPAILGRDVAGTVAEAGEGVAGFAPGEMVFATVPGSSGGYAERVAVDVAEAAAMPDECSFVAAAAVPLAGLTAWQGLFDQGGLQPGQSVLIHGGGGGVGHFAVQFAKAKKAMVTTTAAAEDRDLLLELGADCVIDYRSERFEGAVDEVDMVFDLIGGETRDRSFAVLRPGGILVSTLGQPDEEKAREHRVRVAGYMAHGDAGQLGLIRGMIEGGRLRPVVSGTYSLADAAGAQAALEQKHTQGKIVLTV